MPSRWHNSDSMAIEPPEYEHTLTLSTATSKLDTDSETCLLPVPQDEEDGGASGASTTFATPEGLTPKSSDEEGDSKLQNSSRAQTGEEGSRGQGQGSRSQHSAKDERMDQNLLNVPEVSSRLGHVLTHTQSDHSHMNGLRESQSSDSEEKNSSEPSSKVATKECVQSNGLEKSEGSSTYLHSGSSSQCTLTDSRESTKPADNTSTQVQASQTGQTGHESNESALPPSNSPVEGVDGNVASHPKLYDGSMSPYLAQVPPHLLSINSSEWLGGSEVVTSQPQENGYSRGDLGDTTPTWRPEDSGESREQPVAVVYSSSRGSESEESLSAGSGRYDPTDKGIMAVSEVAIQQGTLSSHRTSPGISPEDTQQRTSPLGHHEISEASGILQNVPDRTSVSPHAAHNTSQPRTSGKRGKLSSEEGMKQRGQRGSPKVSGLVMATKHSPVGSTGTGSSTSEEQSVLAGRPAGNMSEEEPLMAARGGGVHGGWARKKMKGLQYPPSELQMNKEQGSPPDSFHTPNTSKLNFSFFCAYKLIWNIARGKKK